jgi:putative ABC transport system ATP-binding protein
LVRAEGLERAYRLGSTQVRALRGVDLVIGPGEFVALMGPSGCGKSTLLQLLGCLDTPTAGRYWLEGREISTLSSGQRATLRNTRLGFVFQNFFLLPNLNSAENVALPLLYQGDARDVSARAAAALAQVGLSDRAGHRPNQLSGGERQRVALARALVNRPALLLADEPTGNLDSATGAEVMALMTALWRQGLTILLVTHDAQVAAYAQHTLHMRDGIISAEVRSHDPA